MDFDNVISNALKFENDLYNKKYSNSLFRVNRRDKSRLVLTCRYDKTCQFMIRCNKSSGIVKFLVKRPHCLARFDYPDSSSPGVCGSNCSIGGIAGAVLILVTSSSSKISLRSSSANFSSRKLLKEFQILL